MTEAGTLSRVEYGNHRRCAFETISAVAFLDCDRQIFFSPNAVEDGDHDDEFHFEKL